MKKRVLSLIIPMLLGLPSHATVQAVGKYNDWRVFTAMHEGKRFCYAVTKAQDKAPTNVKHGDVLFYVSHMSGKQSLSPSLKVGYDLRPDLPPEAKIGRNSWRFFTAGDEAYVDDRYETKLVAALKKGKELRVEAVSKRNTNTAYHFSLSGSKKAIERARTACK